MPRALQRPGGMTSDVSRAADDQNDHVIFLSEFRAATFLKLTPMSAKRQARQLPTASWVAGVRFQNREGNRNTLYTERNRKYFGLATTQRLQTFAVHPRDRPAKISLPPGRFPWKPHWGVILMMVFLGYLLWLKRYFKTPDPPTQPDALPAQAG